MQEQGISFGRNFFSKKYIPILICKKKLQRTFVIRKMEVFSPSLSIQRGIEFESRTRAAHHFCLKNHISLEQGLLHQIDQNRSINKIDFTSMELKNKKSLKKMCTFWTQSCTSCQLKTKVNYANSIINNYTASTIASTFDPNWKIIRICLFDDNAIFFQIKIYKIIMI